MTTVSTVEDIIEALDSDPLLLEALRARLLTRDLLELPEIVAKLAASQVEMREDIARLAASQVEMREDIARLAASQVEMREDIARLAASQVALADKVAVLTGEVAVLTGKVAVLTGEVVVLKDDVAVLKSDVAVLKDDVAVLKSDVAVLKDDVAVLKGDVAVLKDDVASLKGDHLEMRLQGKVHAMLGQRKRLRGIRVVSAAFPAGMNPEFADAIDYAADNGSITEDQRARIMSTDLIATARRQRSPQTIYVSFEVAHSLNEEDTRRVVETGDALARAFPKAEVMRFIYGQSISARDMSQAEAKGVEVVLERSAR